MYFYAARQPLSLCTKSRRLLQPKRHGLSGGPVVISPIPTGYQRTLSEAAERFPYQEIYPT